MTWLQRHSIPLGIAASIISAFSGCDKSPAAPAQNVARPSADTTSPDKRPSPPLPKADEPPASWRQAAKPKLDQWRQVEGLPHELAQFNTVFWDAADTNSLREWLTPERCQGKRILEIGTGTGLISLWCLNHGAAHVVATDINPNALANAAYNADRLGLSVGEADSKLDLRWVSADDPSAFAVILEQERFDLIVSNPPWEDGTPDELLDFAFYDPGFALLESLMRGVTGHLEPKGRCLLAYGCVTGIRQAIKLAPNYDLHAEIRDDRSLEEVPEVFVPGMLIEVWPQADQEHPADIQANSP